MGSGSQPPLSKRSTPRLRVGLRTSKERDERSDKGGGDAVAMGGCRGRRVSTEHSHQSSCLCDRTGSMQDRQHGSPTWLQALKEIPMSRVAWILVAAGVILTACVAWEVWRVDRQLTQRKALRDAMLRRLQEQ